MSVPMRYMRRPMTSGQSPALSDLRRILGAGRALSGLGALPQGSGQYLGDAGSALGIYSGLQRGGFPGYAQAGVNAARLGRNLGALPQGAGPYIGDASNLLGIYSGIKQGGWQGDTRAGLNAAQLGSNVGALAPEIGQYAGYAAIPLAAYNFVQNDTASGRTGQDALGGAETGAEIGTAIMPGIGTIVGGLIGGAGGAIASAFGPGAKDPEQYNWQDYFSQYQKNPQSVTGVGNPANTFQNLAGVFDARSSDVPFYHQFGRMGEGQFLNSMADRINQATTAGTIKPGASSSDIFNQVVNPWIGTMSNPSGTGGKGWDAGGGYGGDVPALQNLVKSLIGEYTTGAITPSTPIGVSGERDTALPQYAGLPASFYANAAAPSQPRGPRFNGPSGHLAARGGSMRSTDFKGRLANLKTVYRGSFADRRKRYQDGGGVSYAGNPYSSYYYTNSPTPSYTGSTPPDTSPGFSQSDYGVPPWMDPANAGTDVPATNTQPGFSLGDYGAGSSGGTSALAQALKNWPGNATGAGGLAGLLSAYAPLLPLIGAATAPNRNAQNPPTAMPGMTQGSGALPAPNFNRSQIANPSNLPGGAPMSLNDWYTYGQRPEASFFQNNAVPTGPMTGMPGSPAPAVSPSPIPGAPTGMQPPAMMPPTVAPRMGIQPLNGAIMARGGALGQTLQGHEFDSSREHYARGPGTGTSDSIPAQLSDGEYVIDAGTVSMLGSGSNEAGARALDQLRENIRKQAGKQMVKGKQFMKAKPPAAYLKGKKGEANGRP